MTIVTTIQNTAADLEITGQEIALRLRISFVPRANHSLASLRDEYQSDTILVVGKNKLVAHTAAGEYFFHVNMAEFRIKNLICGNPDHMVTALAITAGSSVLDCTLGLGTDAIVASYAAGAGGHIVGLEHAAVVSLITEYGLASYACANQPMQDAMRRIQVIHANYRDFLPQCADNSYDTVYFDPMFRRPIDSSSNMKPLRLLADASPLTPEALQHARRVARKRVVMKETPGSREFSRLGFQHFVGGKYSSICYGIMEAGG